MHRVDPEAGYELIVMAARRLVKMEQMWSMGRVVDQVAHIVPIDIIF